MVCLALLAVSGVLLFASYSHARDQADALIAKLPKPPEPYSNRFCLIRSITGEWRPCWEFSYEARDSFGPGPLTLRATLRGEVVASNPSDAIAKLKALR